MYKKWKITYVITKPKRHYWVISTTGIFVSPFEGIRKYQIIMRSNQCTFTSQPKMVGKKRLFISNLKNNRKNEYLNFKAHITARKLQKIKTKNKNSVALCWQHLEWIVIKWRLTEVYQFLSSCPSKLQKKKSNESQPYFQLYVKCDEWDELPVI